MPSHPLSRILARSVPGGSRAKGRVYQLDGAVTQIQGSPWDVSATVNGSREYRTAVFREGDVFTGSCECPYFTDSLAICKHIWATVLEAERLGYLLGDGDVPPTARLAAAGDETDPEFALPRTTTRREPRPWDRFLREFSEQLAHQPPPSTRFSGAQIIYVIDRVGTANTQTLALEIESRRRKKSGDWGRPKGEHVSPSDVDQLPDAADREIIPLLLGAGDVYGYGYAGYASRAAFRLAGPLLDRVLPLIVQTGRAFLRIRPAPGQERVALTWDDGPPWTFKLEVVPAAGHEGFSIDGAFVRGSERMAMREPWAALNGYLFYEGSVARLDARGAFTWLTHLRTTGPMTIPIDATGQLVDILARSGVNPEDLPEELRFEVVAAAPQPRLTVRPDRRRGPEAPLVATVTFDYDGAVVEEGSGTTAFDAGHRRLIRRDAVFEAASVARLYSLGFSKQWDYLDAKQRLAIPQARFLSAVRTLMDEGWRVDAEGRTFRTAESMRSEVRSGIDWFELHGTVEFGDGRSVPLPRLLAALKQGRSTVILDDGTEGIVPEEWLRRWSGVAGMGEDSGDHVRFRPSQAALLDAALAALPEVRVDEQFARIRDELTTFTGVAALDASSSFAGQLRDYQRDALGWFSFLRRFGFGGCLADDMGLGKTVMVLAWLDLLRARRDAKGPSIVVAPRSIVFNWIEEAARFAPKLRVLDFSGAGRSAEDPRNYDLVLTTYGTLRRDAIRLQDVEFEYAVLDESQAIKNASTAGAKAARLLRARYRLALSGTPIENHLGELWSLFEFLNPGLLGSSTMFSRHSLAASRRDPEAMEVLTRGLRPFILRRTKSQVAPELPDRTEQTVHCELKGTQRELYDELRDHYRASLLGRIEREGLQKSKMHVLEALLRLRQAACHPALVDPKRGAAGSAKFDALLPHLGELREEGHKALVFSQFTSLLALLRARLDADGVTYEYLDGKTRDRDVRVNRFQTDPACGLFLISLKAGGLGLNLTAAEYVFLLDPWWNPAVEAQAIDRAHRIGQTHHVFAYRLIAANTVEEKIAELQRTKRELADAILQADAGLLRQLRVEDVEVLLS